MVATETMHAMAFRQVGPSTVLEPVRLPKPRPGPGEILVRVAASGVNPADWLVRSGRFRLGIDLTRPFVPGADIAGVVEVTGPGVTTLRPGDAVVAMNPVRASGACAEFVRCRAEHAALAPVELTLGEAAALPLAALTALQALRDHARLIPGMRVLIHGATGGVGSHAVQVARALGATVVATARRERLDRVAALGASAVLDREAHDPTPALQVDAVLDAVGAHGFHRWRHIVRRGGTVVTVRPSPVRLALGWAAGPVFGRRCATVFVRPDAEDLSLLAGWVDAGMLRPVVEREFALQEVGAAHDLSEAGRVFGKLVVVVDPTLAAQCPASLVARAPAPATLHHATSAWSPQP